MSSHLSAAKSPREKEDLENPDRCVISLDVPDFPDLKEQMFELVLHWMFNRVLHYCDCIILSFIVIVFKGTDV